MLPAGTKGSRPIYIERLFCSSSISSRPRHPPSSSSSCRAAVVVYPHPAAPFSRPASRRIPSPPLHPIPPSVAEASRAPTAVELDLYCALDRLPSSSLSTYFHVFGSKVFLIRFQSLYLIIVYPYEILCVIIFNWI